MHSQEYTVTKQIFKPKKLERFTLEQYNGDVKNDLKDTLKDGLLVRVYNSENYIWNEAANTWQVLTAGDYVEQLADGTFNRRHSVEVTESMEPA